MEYWKVDTSKKDYPLVLQEGFFNKFDAGEELKKQINKFYPEALTFTTLSSRVGNGKSEQLMECYFNTPESSHHKFYIYVFPFEGGGRSSMPYEQRIQIPPHSKWNPDLNTLGIAKKFLEDREGKENKECYIIGIYKTGPNDDDVIFTGIYPNKMIDIEFYSSSNTSIQASILSIRDAYLNNVSVQDKGNADLPFIIVNFKPQYILWYMENRDRLHLSDIESAKRIGNNIIGVPEKGTNSIFYGAPGTGKSHAIDEKTGKKNRLRVTFHPDTDYASFVGCYKPTMELDEDGNEKIKYEFIPQKFLDAYIAAWQNPRTCYYLIIEEINRGNCAQIFGDIFQLLDRDKQGFSSYVIQADNEIKKYLKKVMSPDGEDKYQYISRLQEHYPEDYNNIDYGTMALPQNLTIYATMNTSDQSLFPMDSAFKRRWDWVYMPIENGNKGWMVKLDDSHELIDWWKFLQQINQVIANLTSSEDKQLGYYFCSPDLEEEMGGNNVPVISAERFVGKVIFYLWNDVFKDYAFDADCCKDKDNNNKEMLFAQFYEGKAVNVKTLTKFFSALENNDAKFVKEKIIIPPASSASTPVEGATVPQMTETPVETHAAEVGSTPAE